jgi:hypothetical protein
MSTELKIGSSADREHSHWDIPDLEFVSSPQGYFLTWDANERIQVSADLAFALGELFGMFEAVDGGYDIDGTRLLFTRKMRLEEVYGEQWQRYARARLEFDAAHGVPLRICGLPRRGTATATKEVQP